MNALLLRAADSRWLRYAGIALLWSGMAIAERVIQMPAGMRFPGLLLLAITVAATVAGRTAAAATIGASLAFTWLSMRSAPMPGDAERLLVFAVVAAIASALAASLRELRQERNALRAELAERAAREEHHQARDQVAASMVEAARNAEHEARAARDELAAAHEKFAAFMAAFPYPAFIHDEQGRFVFVNDAGRASRAWQDSMAPGAASVGTAGDERRYFSIRFPVHVAGRAWLGGIAIDVSERARTERALRGYEAELEREVKRRDEFLAVLAHELRNPLAPVQHSVQILHRAPHDVERVRRATATIDKQVALMERLIDDLLDVARISQGLVELDPQPRPLPAIVEGALDVVRPVAQRTGHRFDARHDDPHAFAFVDAFRAEQVVVNLLSNAVKYSPPGSTVWIHTGVNDGMCRIAVADEGQGILPEHLGEIFTMFARPGIGQQPKQSGMGVGLALAKQLAEQQGGRIEASSAGRDRGATFAVWFPRP